MRGEPRSRRAARRSERREALCVSIFHDLPESIPMFMGPSPLARFLMST